MSLWVRPVDSPLVARHDVANFLCRPAWVIVNSSGEVEAAFVNHNDAVAFLEMKKVKDETDKRAS
jgi:hypothetical protein